MGRFKECESVVKARELAIKEGKISEARQSVEQLQEELDQLNKQQEEAFAADRVGAIALKGFELKAMKQESFRINEEMQRGHSTEHIVLESSQRKDFENIRREHEDLDKERKACLDALKAYKKANDAYKAKTRKLIEEYGEDWAEATGWIKPNPNRNAPDYHVQFVAELKQLFKE